MQLLVYREDLFDEAGLEEPTSYDAIAAAAEELDSPDLAGFVGADIAGDAFTEQTFEHIALGNECRLVDDAGEVTLDSDKCGRGAGARQLWEDHVLGHPGRIRH